MSETNEAALRRAIDAFNDPSDRERYLELYAPDVSLHGYPEGVQGSDGARNFYTQVWAAFPDARIGLEETLACDDRLAARYTLTGIQIADFYGAPVTGRATTMDGMAMLRFRDGRVVEDWQVSGTLNTLTRLSARAAKASAGHSASAEAAALRWEETHSDS